MPERPSATGIAWRPTSNKPRLPPGGRRRTRMTEKLHLRSRLSEPFEIPWPFI
jgi:hypothetical protein